MMENEQSLEFTNPIYRLIDATRVFYNIELSPRCMTLLERSGLIEHYNRLAEAWQTNAATITETVNIAYVYTMALRENAREIYQERVRRATIVNDAIRIYTTSRLLAAKENDPHTFIYKPSFETALQYAATVRNNTSDQEILKTMMQEIAQQAESQQQAYIETDFTTGEVDPNILITADLLNNRAVLKSVVLRMCHQGAPITISANSKDEFDTINAAVNEIVAEEGIQLSDLIVSMEDLTPFNIIKDAKANGIFDTEHRLFLEEMVQMRFRAMADALNAFKDLLINIQASTALTQPQRIELIKGVMDAVGAGETGRLLVDQLTGIERNELTLETSRVVDVVYQACCALRIHSKEQAQTFAKIVLNLAGVDEKGINKFLFYLENPVVREQILNGSLNALTLIFSDMTGLDIDDPYITFGVRKAKGGSGIGRFLNNSGKTLFNGGKGLFKNGGKLSFGLIRPFYGFQFTILDIPNPIEEPHEFGIWLGARIKDLMWLEGFGASAFFVTSIGRLIAESQGIDTFSDVNLARLWLYQVPMLALTASLVPRLNSNLLNLDSANADKILGGIAGIPLVGIPFKFVHDTLKLGKFLEWAEGLGVGGRPMNFSRYTPVEWFLNQRVANLPGSMPVTKTKVKQAFLSTGMNPDLQYPGALVGIDASASDDEIKSVKTVTLNNTYIRFTSFQAVTGQTTFATGFGLHSFTGLEPFQEDWNTKLNFKNFRFFPLSNIMRWLNIQLASCEWVRNDYQWSAQGYEGKNIDVPWQFKFKYGLLRIIAGFFPQIEACTPKGWAANLEVIETGTDTTLKTIKAPLPRRLAGSHAAANAVDYAWSLASIGFTVMLVNVLKSAFPQINLDNVNLYKSLETGLANLPHIGRALNTVPGQFLLDAALLPTRFGTNVLSRALETLGDPNLSAMYSILYGALWDKFLGTSSGIRGAIGGQGPSMDDPTMGTIDNIDQLGNSIPYNATWGINQGSPLAEHISKTLTSQAYQIPLNTELKYIIVGNDKLQILFYDANQQLVQMGPLIPNLP